MHAAVLHKFGESPRFESFPDPAPAEGEALIRVKAAALNPSTKGLTSGSESAGSNQLPLVCGVDGVGTLDNGTRVFFAGPRHPFGSMAELTVVPDITCWPVPDGIDDAVAAALPNPGLSSWIPLTWRAKLVPGETVLILGATGTAGRLAIQVAKILGAGRVVACGRNPHVLRTLPDVGADAIIALDQHADQLIEAFATEGGERGYDVILDYLWGPPAEVLLSAMPHRGFNVPTEIRYVPVGSSAGQSAISLDVASLRRTGVVIGSGSLPTLDFMRDAFTRFMEHASHGRLSIDIQDVPLADVEKAWISDPQTRRLVITP